MKPISYKVMGVERISVNNLAVLTSRGLLSVLENNTAARTVSYHHVPSILLIAWWVAGVQKV